MYVRNRNTTDVMTVGEFRAAHSNTSFPRVITPELLDAFGFDPVLEGAQPTGELWQHVEPDGVEQIGDQWFTKWKLVPDVLDEDGLNAQRDLKLAALAAKRWEVETGGITLPGGLFIKTDEDTQRKITGAYVQAVRNPAMTVRWKVAPAAFVTLDAATIIMIGDAVTAHIQAAFDHESNLADIIVAAADWSELSAVDINAGW